MAKKTLLSPPETFHAKRQTEFLDPGINIPVPQAVSPEQRAQMEAEFERRSRDAEAQIQETGLLSSTDKEDTGSLKLIPVKDLEVSPWNARSAPLGIEELQKLMQAISLEGVQSPVHVYPIPGKSDRYAILDGQRRFRAALALNISAIPAIVHEAPEPLKAYMLSHMLSDTGEKPDVLDNALIWKKFLDEGLVRTAEELALMLGVSKASISKALYFYKISEENQRFLLERREPVSWRSLESLYKAEAQYGAEKVQEVIKDMADTESLMEVLASLDRSESRRKRRYSRSSDREPIVVDGAVVGTVSRSKGRLTVDLPYLEFDDDLARRAIEAVKASLSSPL